MWYNVRRSKASVSPRAGAKAAYDTSTKLGITGRDKFGYTLSGLLFGDFLVSLNNWDTISETIDINNFNFKFDKNPYYSFWNAPLYAIHLKSNEYKDVKSRTTLGLYLELQAHYLFYLLGNEHATDGCHMGPTDEDPTGAAFEILASVLRVILFGAIFEFNFQQRKGTQ